MALIGNMRHDDVVACDLANFGNIGDAGDIKRARKLGADLRGIAVDGHLSANDEVGVSNMFDAKRKRVAGGKSVGAGKKLFLKWAAKVTEMGGAVSAEHGVGKIKRDFLTVMYGKEHIAQMASLKAQLDPKAQLGRGNLFAPETADAARKEAE